MTPVVAEPEAPTTATPGAASGSAPAAASSPPAETSTQAWLGVGIGFLGALLGAAFLSLAFARTQQPRGVPKIELVAAGGYGAAGAAPVRVADQPTWAEVGDEGANALSLAGRALANRGSIFDDPALVVKAPEVITETVVEREIPRSERWQIFFAEGLTEQAYAEQLDFFGIELGVLGENGQIEYAFNLSQKTTGKRAGPADQEKRLYMSWTRGNFAEADRSLLAKSGIDGKGKIILHFYSESTENRLASLEEKFEKRKPGEILRTRFGAKPSADGFTFFVLEQTPLK